MYAAVLLPLSVYDVVKAIIKISIINLYYISDIQILKLRN